MFQAFLSYQHVTWKAVVPVHSDTDDQDFLPHGPAKANILLIISVAPFVVFTLIVLPYTTFSSDHSFWARCLNNLDELLKYINTLSGVISDRRDFWLNVMCNVKTGYTVCTHCRSDVFGLNLRQVRNMITHYPETTLFELAYSCFVFVVG